MIQLVVGAMAPKLSVQLRNLGFDAKELEAFDQDADAITRLYFRGLISQGQCDAARNKLIKKISKREVKHATPSN